MPSKRQVEVAMKFVELVVASLTAVARRSTTTHLSAGCVTCGSTSRERFVLMGSCVVIC
ncbi:MAG: hypothetical protein AAB886_02480 [Patescibacteria group bacterium]